MKDERFLDYISKGLSCIATSQYKKAILYLDKALDIDDQDIKVWLEKAKVLALMNHPDAAINCFNFALHINPHNPLIWYKKGLLCYEQNKFREAVECYNKALKLNPEFIEALESKKLALSNLEQYNEISYDMTHTADDEADIDPVSGDIKSVINTWECLSEYTGFVNNYKKDREKEKEIWFKDGMELLNSGRFQEAIPCFDTVLDADPQNEPAWYGKGRCHIFLKGFNEAIKAFQKTIEINERNIEAWKLMGYAHSQLGEYRKAIACFDQVLKMDVYHDNRHIDTLFNKAHSLFSLREYEASILCCEEIIRNGRKCYNEAQELKYNGLFKLGKYDEIIRDYDERIEKDKNDSTLWYEKGVFFNKTNRYREAINCFTRVIELDPEDDAAYYQMSFAWFNLALYKKALISIVHAIDLYQNESDYHLLKEKIVGKISGR